ncbi:MAG: hypothetical protein SVK08_00275 [Halobacteriota archaeon]|nr:hypothetical protein [Halobacteriota archaeon]
MGTYLRYSVQGNEIPATKINEICGGWFVWDEEDRKIEIEKGDRGCPDFLDLYHGQFKVSGGVEDEEIEDFLEKLKKVKESGISVDFSKSDNVSHCLSDDQGSTIFGSMDTWMKFKKGHEKDEHDYQVAYDIYQKYNRKMSIGGTVFRARTWGDREVGFMYANCDIPKIKNVVLPDDAPKPPIELGIREYTTEGDSIILVPLQALGREKCFGDGENKYDIYELYTYVSSMGIVVNFYRFAFWLYKRIPTESSMENPEAYAGFTREEIDEDIQILARDIKALPWTEKDQTIAQIKSMRNKRNVKSLDGEAMYFQFLMHANRGLFDVPFYETVERFEKYLREGIGG